jgi:hypothetical protein
VITALVILWRDWRSVVSGLLLALMVVFIGQDVELLGLALILVVVTLIQAVRADIQRTRLDPSQAR